MNTKTQVLVTNDDGVDAPGIIHLARALEAAGYNVSVVAPSYNASGTGTALGHISPGNPVSVEDREIRNFNGTVKAIDGPPALCVMLANLGLLPDRPDVVISGTNAGLNTGRSVLHSGTVGAVLAAQNFGMRGLAVSLGKHQIWHWEHAADLAVQVLPSLLAGPKRCALNLNVPPTRPSEMKGIRWGCLATYNAVRSTVTGIVDGKVNMAMERPDFVPDPESDLGLTDRGFSALTALHGNSEVWSEHVQPDYDFNPDNPLPGVTAGDELRPARVYLKA